MSWTDIIYSIGDLFRWAFGFFEFVQNHFNNVLLLLGFFGFAYWMNIQRKYNENTGWYKDAEGKQIK